MGDSVLPNAKVWQHWADLAPDQQSKVAPDQLILPHPRLQDRAFVLVPLADIAPDWRHPMRGQTVLQMLHACPQSEIDAVRPL
jgi:2-amino-4-hydroxy-6-hydroxymethyldihydropteridine diphosphokinase